MNYAGLRRSLLNDHNDRSAIVPAWTPSRPKSLQPALVHRRRHEIQWLNTDGTTGFDTVLVPALPMFESAANAFARGALVQTPDGYTAVEDLQPGMEISAADGNTHIVQWIGSISVFPNSGVADVPNCSLYRVAEGCFGAALGMPDLMIGPGARVIPHGRHSDQMAQLEKIESLMDGFSVIPVTPRSPVQLYHIALSSHQLIRVNNVLMESYHPGHSPQLHVSEEMFHSFRSLFPHVGRVSDFGPVNYRRQE